VEDELSVASDDLPAHGDKPDDISPHINDLPAYLAEGSNVAGRRRRQNFSGEGETSGASYVGAQDLRSTNMGEQNNSSLLRDGRTDAGRKRRREPAEGLSSGTSGAGRKASRAVPEARARSLSGGGVGRRG
jgi:hypothetical protein